MDFPFGDEKVRPNWRMRRSTEDRFRKFVAKKYGLMQRGLLDYEHDRALNEYVRIHSRNTAARTRNSIALSHLKVGQVSDLQKAVQLRDAMVKYFIDSGRYEEPPTKVPLYMLKWAICAVSGVSDERALKRRLVLLQSAGLIKQLDWISKEYAIIYGQYSDLDSTSKENLR